MRFFFVMGAPKSGTTWLQTIMNAHPEISCFGEGHFIDQIVLPMQDLLRRYNQKLEVVAQAVYSGAPCYPPMTGPDANMLVRSLITGLLRRGEPDPNSLWWGDKTPAYAVHVRLLDGLFPYCRFIDIIRDPRDVAVSSLHHARRAGIFEDFAQDRERRREQLKFSAVRWAQHARAIGQARQQFGHRLLEVRFEDLLTDLPRQLRRLYAHLPGLATTEAIIEDVQRRCSFAAMSGGRQRGEIDEDSFFRSGTSGQHEHELSDEERSLVESLTA